MIGEVIPRENLFKEESEMTHPFDRLPRQWKKIQEGMSSESYIDTGGKMINEIDTEKISGFFGEGFTVDVTECDVTFTKNDQSSLMIIPVTADGKACLEFSFDQKRLVDVLTEAINKIASIVNGTEELTPNSTNWQLALDCNEALNNIVQLCYEAKETVKIISRRERDAR